MKKIIFFLILFSVASFSFAQRTLIHCGTLINGKNKDLLTQVTVVVEGNKIISVDKGFTKAGKDDKVIDLSKKTVSNARFD